MEEKSWFIQYLPQLFIVAGILLTAIGGWVSFSRMVKYRTENLTLGNTNKGLNEKNLAETKKVKEISEVNTLLSVKNESLLNENTTLTKLNQELIKSNIEIANSNSELSKQLLDRTEVLNSEITGGSSYLKIWMHYNEKTKMIDISGIIDGEYNLKNIRLTITENKNKVLDQKLDELNKNVVYDIRKIVPPKDRNILLYSIDVTSRNGSYFQYVLFKKHTDNIWYGHSVYYEDKYQRWFREEEYFPYSYPEELKISTPQITDYIKFEKDNASSLKSVEDMIKSQPFRTDEWISRFTITPLRIVRNLRKKIEASTQQ